MSEHDEAPPPMDPDLRALLRGTKSSFDAEASRHLERALGRLEQARPEIARRPPDPEPSPPVESTAAKVGIAKLVLPVMTASVIAGAAITYVAMPVRERIVYVDRPVALAASALPSASPPSVRVEDLPAAPKPLPAPSTAGVADVSAERLLLDEARVAYASGDYAKSLDRLHQHRARFPSGALTEEREALTVRALAASGNKAEAAKRARAFVKKYPESIMRPAVEAAAQEP